jgi:hypothetical protein
MLSSFYQITHLPTNSKNHFQPKNFTELFETRQKNILKNITAYTERKDLMSQPGKLQGEIFIYRETIYMNTFWSFDSFENPALQTNMNETDLTQSSFSISLTFYYIQFPAFANNKNYPHLRNFFMIPAGEGVVSN